MLPSLAVVFVAGQGQAVLKRREDVEAYKFEIIVNYKPIVGDDVESNDESLI